MATKNEKPAKNDKAVKDDKKTETVEAIKKEKPAKSVKADKVEKPVNSNDDINSDSEKKNKLAEKLKAMGLMGGGKKLPNTESNTFASLWMALVVAIPAGLLVAYVVMPDELNTLFTSSDTATDENLNNYYARSQMPAHPYAGNWSRSQEPEWVTQQRAEMEMRRSNFARQNAENRRAAEPPQWVKDQQEWAKRSGQPQYNRPNVSSGYMNNSGMNSFSQNQAHAQNPVPYYNGNIRAVNPYGYNNGAYNGQYNSPYGQNSYSYR